MKNLYILLVVLLICFISCKKNRVLDVHDIPACVQEIINDQPSMTIYGQAQDDEVHYWINTGASQVDGVEPIVNSSCDTVCTFGGWIVPDCYSTYEEDAWEQVNP